MSLLTRYDLRALRPPDAGSAAAPAELLAWCRATEGRFASCDTEAEAAALDALMRELDGDRALQALPAAAQWRWRLSLKLREALGLRRADDPWDCGWLRDVNALAQFSPRRPTLIVSCEPGALAALALAARAEGFRHPVRLLRTRRSLPEPQDCP